MGHWIRIITFKFAFFLQVWTFPLKTPTALGELLSRFYLFTFISNSICETGHARLSVSTKDRSSTVSHQQQLTSVYRQATTISESHTNWCCSEPPAWMGGSHLNSVASFLFLLMAKDKDAVLQLELYTSDRKKRAVVNSMRSVKERYIVCSLCCRWEPRGTC